MFTPDSEGNKEFTLTLKPVAREPQLVIIPINEEQGIIAVVKPYGLGQASCIAFAPATKLSAPFEGFKPSFLRKTVTNDFALRQGAWKPLSLDSANAVALRNAVVVLMNDMEMSKPENIQRIDLSASPDLRTSQEAAYTNYRAPEQTPFEQALCHLLGVKHRTATTAQAVSSDGTTAA